MKSHSVILAVIAIAGSAMGGAIESPAAKTREKPLMGGNVSGEGPPAPAYKQGQKRGKKRKGRKK